MSSQPEPKERASNRIILSAGAILNAKTFSSEWNSSADAYEILCGFELPPSVNIDAVRALDLRPFVKHLQTMGLAIIATGIATMIILSV